jgi:hypothetical protein
LHLKEYGDNLAINEWQMLEQSMPNTLRIQGQQPEP